MSLIINDVIFLRRPTLNYVCPPACEVLFSSTGFPVIVLNPVPHHGAPTVRIIITDVCPQLNWDAYPGAICYNVYKAVDSENPETSPYEVLLECTPDTSICVDPGCYRVSAITADGESDLSAPVCTASAPPIPTPPDVATDPATDVEGASVTLNGNAKANGSDTNVYFEFGTDTSYGTTTTPQPIGSGTSTVLFSAPMTGLCIGTEYHFRAVATNAIGTVFGTDESFILPDPVLPVTAGLIARWEADAIMGLNDGDPVSIWPDQSPSGRDAMQNTPFTNPVYKTDGYCNKAIVRFEFPGEGGGDILTFVQPAGISVFTVFCAWNMTIQASSFSFGPLRVRDGTTGSGFSFVGDGVSTSNPLKHLVVWNGLGVEIANFKGPDEGLMLPGTPRGKAIDTWRWDGVTATMRKNGGSQLVLPGNPFDYSGTGFPNIGYPFNPVAGDIGAILIYDTVLSDADIALVETYLNAKYPTF